MRLVYAMSGHCHVSHVDCRTDRINVDVPLLRMTITVLPKGSSRVCFRVVAFVLISERNRRAQALVYSFWARDGVLEGVLEKRERVSGICRL